MSFNPAIPQPNDLISQSQSQIQTNFSQADTAFGIDHTPFSTVSNQGKHKKSTYIEQGSNPATLANEMAVFSKDLAAVTTLYLRKESNGTVIQMSGRDPIDAASGCTFLPGGFLLQWGTYTITSHATTQAVSFAATFGTVYSLTITGNITNNNSMPSYSGLSTTGFTGKQTTGNFTTVFTYIAIGK